MVKKRRSTLSKASPRKSSKKAITFEVEKHIAREIWAVFYLALAALTWLSLNQQLGFLGEVWMSILRPVFGVGLGAVPFALLFMGASVFFSKKITWGFSRLTGIVFFTVAILGFVHMKVPADQLLEVAQRGESGGYIGFVSSFIFTSAFGREGAYVLLTATFLVGILLTFQVSLGAILRFFLPSTKVVKKTIGKVTPDFKLTDDDEDEDEDVRIVQPDIVKDDEPAMSLKEVKPEEVQVRLAKAAEPVEDKEDEIVVVGAEGSVRAIEWEYPPLDLLDASQEVYTVNEGRLKAKASVIKGKLDQFGIPVTMHEVHVGPTVVQYTLRPSEGVKLSKITSLKNDLALALAASAVRIEAPIPGKSLVGIEIPNESRATVHMREIMEAPEYKAESSKLKLALGRDVAGKAVVADLAKMPHLLIAGATGSGKSVGMNSFLISLLYNNSPQELRFIMIDPKQVELTPYNGLPHLLTPVITDPEKAATSLRWAVAEMNRRYKICADAGCRNIAEYNRNRPVSEYMSKIVIVIDELADLMMQAQKEVEASICRIAQMARAVGMHLIIATQRPSVDVITGLIKANIPARIAFTVASQIDSRTILDGQGAEDLLGMGDMLYLSGTMGKPIRVQGIYISTEETERVTNRIKLTHEADDEVYMDEITSKETARLPVQGVPDTTEDPKSDEELMMAALAFLRKNKKGASTSALQRYFRIGYARAGRLMDMLEERGYVGPAQGAKARDVRVQEDGEGEEGW
jgi:S-DNA-T family DNA segregation ATPase FtsK/SpoIIIE